VNFLSLLAKPRWIAKLGYFISLSHSLRLEEQKGHRYLIEALALLRHRGIVTRLLLAGEGRERPALEALVVSLGFEQQVMLLGIRNDLGDLFRAMDVWGQAHHEH
jgi:glycosyltransferase involved in cell wall biosynthesis